ncbi:MAG: ATP-binding cassette domain-containing protein [Gammaproteobacteria bacterium]|jgi:ATP-binding cassette subfamily B protein/subfamily B ATP-binding cassette protein MsbA|uniref:ABC transporter transmembrane domain-containing protein n=1 Tax=Marinomonas TaxID=28253 RepID=UPI000C282159|nr:ABC transporter transmembrane domain-containing protein [Marinomonas sp. ef1]MBU2319172.1 ATP-binding cassette domain-containing protein [Gammaproteobacteria bacterium]
MSKPENVENAIVDRERVDSGIKTFLPFLRPYRRHIVLALIALVVTAGTMLSLGKGVQLLIDQGLASGSEAGLTHALMIFIALVFLLGIGSFCRFYLVSWIGERVVADIRQAVFAHLLTLSPSFFEDNSPSEIQSRITSDTTLLQSVIGSSLSIALRSSLMLIGGILFLLVMHFKLTLILLTCVPFVIVPVVYFGRRVRRLSRDSQDEVANVGRYLSQALRHIKVVQAFTHEKHDAQRFSATVDRAFNVSVKRIQQRSWLTLMVILLSMSGIGVMLWFGGKDVISGAISAGDLASFLFYSIIVAGAVGAISEVMGELQRAAGAAERIMELLSAKSVVVSGSTEFPSQRMAEIRQGEEVIKFDNVEFRYPTRPDYAALKNLSFSIKQGEMLALVGPSGAGKSTLFELLLRFYDPQQGGVYLAGENIKEYFLDDLRQHFALVPQETVLFDQTVYDNLGYANRNASKESIQYAASQANAHEFIARLDKGYETRLGEDGVRLSGGQRQRVAIARAILKDAPILLLDEATSALDAESENKVQAALEPLMKGRTTLVIAHRLATVLNADRIVVMDQGEIIAQGTHVELLETCALYKRLADLQFNQHDDAQSD